MSRYIGILISTVLWLLPFSEIYAVKGEKKDSRKGVDTTSFYYTEPKCVYGFFATEPLLLLQPKVIIHYVPSSKHPKQL
mgnify:CR=1 FL=1